MSTMLFFEDEKHKCLVVLDITDEKTLKVLLQSSPSFNSAIVAFANPLTKILNETQHVYGLGKVQ